MLKTAEKSIPKPTPQVLMVKSGKVQKKKAKAKVGKSAPKPKVSGSSKAKVPKDAVCFHCNQKGHWKRNCPAYLEEVKAKKTNDASTSGTFVIELFTSYTNSWVLDTGCGTHICSNIQGLKEVREMKQGELDLHMGNGARVCVKAIGVYELLLPSGLYLQLKNCVYAPSLTKNIVSFSMLMNDDFDFRFTNMFISVYFSNMLYFEARPYHGIFELR